MTQQDRDRLVALKKARKGLITQREAAAEIGQSERHVRRLLVKLKKEGDRAVVPPQPAVCGFTFIAAISRNAVLRVYGGGLQHLGTNEQSIVG